ncbi:unnamed protein product [Paramecium sonneborni]|uniref:Transmembrane protein n=1 Tax=Paramecium sonneborni TaxID=65129 RepID=A0A8S1P4L4_9CILI|nr:unnamed protein product [Paramecium sonneborni]
MNDDSQIETQSFQINLNNYGIDSYFAYGLWSRYTPLGRISLVGSLGVLDSNCFHLHNAIEQETKELNLIVYDCLNFETQTIVRRIQFITIDGNWHFFEVKLDNQKYEYVWHYFEITQWPQRKRFEYLVIQYPQTKLYIIKEDILFPYKESNLMLTFGGGLLIQSEIIIQILEGRSKFSFFPGKFYLYPLSTGTMFISRNAAVIALNVFMPKQACAQNKELSKLETVIFPSQNPNCNSFYFQTWIKITNIHQSQEEFLYQMIKLSASFEDSQLSNANLAAFQMFYKFGSQNNQIIFTTYSYTFPLVSINFQDNPYLIRKEFILQNDIKLWHFVQVVLQNNQIQTTIIFYQENQNQEYKFQQTVNQFRVVQFKLQYGNLLKLDQDYISTKFLNAIFQNCVSFLFLPGLYCFNGCSQCDGPTSTDCLSCSINSKRQYIAEQKSCVCPYNTVDDYNCYDYSGYNFILVKEEIKKQRCLQGYFQFDDNCIKCPSIISDTSITCLECVYQPDTWARNSFCKTTLFIDQQGTVSKFLQTTQQYYIYDGHDLQTRYSSDTSIIDNDLSDELDLAEIEFKSFCFQTSSMLSIERSQKECYNCQLQNCLICQITASKTICLFCDYFSSLQDGLCIQSGIVGNIIINKCQSPYYQTSTYQCQLCNIENCLYCFEYLSNDLTKCTLYKDFSQFYIDENHKVGCALCIDDFIFDFVLGICKLVKPKIQNCQRSFINLEGQEICTLSKIDDFSVAPEIINCQKYIPFCKQCLQSSQKLIKCILCEDGYTTSIITGLCQICTIQYAKICIEGDRSQRDGWVQLIQSFLMQFLPNQYLYPKPYTRQQIITQPLKCVDGYQSDLNNNCIKYCDTNCLQCLMTDHTPYQFYCNKCPLNYYKLPIRSISQSKCIQCPQLCQVCQSRTDQELKNINPYFRISDQTLPYTFKCLQRAPDHNIIIDPYTYIAKYCENSICTDNIQYQVDINCQNLQQTLGPNFETFYQKNINTDYCNKLGIQMIIIFMRIQIEPNSYCVLPNLIDIQNNLKEIIFTLQKIKLYMTSQNQFGLYKPIGIFNFDIVEINQMVFEIRKLSYLTLENNSSQIDLIINNSIIFGELNDIQQYSINIQQPGNLIIENLQIMTLNLHNSTLLDYISKSSESLISIQNLVIYNSTFTNSVLFSFFNLKQQIQISEIKFYFCKFYNSTIFSFNSNSKNSSQIYFQNLNLDENIFINSSLIFLQNQISIYLDNVQITNNQFKDSILLNLNYNLVIKEIWLYQNIFILSLFTRITEVEGQSNTIIIDELSINQNQFQTSSILETKLYTNNSLTDLYLTNLQIKDNNQLFESKEYMFNINCLQILIQNCVITNSNNINHFNLLEIYYITIKNIIYQNTKQKRKVPLSFECLNNQLKNSQLLQISGFYKLFIEKIRIWNLFSIDFSFLHILSNIFYSPDVREIIEIKDAEFQGNILLKHNLGILFSQILIYSEKFQEITFENIRFLEGFFNEQIDDPSQSSAGLIFINSQKSSVIINNLICQSNAITNSSNSYIFINANSVQIKTIKINNHNFLNQIIWNTFYEIPIFNERNQDDINQIINQIFTIQNKGGVMSITSSNIYIAEGQFSQISSDSNSLFDIKTQGFGIVHLESLDISQAEVDLLSTTETQGCIAIYSKNSMLNLQIKNVTFQNIFNRLSSSILSITPSQKFNKIEILNVKLKNCLSLINQFMKIEFSQQKQEQNLVLIQDLLISQSDIDWIEYFKKIDPISQSELDKVNIDNAIINLNGCQIFITGLIIHGTFISPILKITDSPKIQIQDFKLNSIKTFYSFNILQFTQTKTQKTIMHLEAILMKNITLFKKSNDETISQKIVQNKYYMDNCTIKSTPINQNQSSNSLFLILKYLTQNISSSGSLIFLQSISMENIINFRSFSIIENNYLGNIKGLIYFELAGFQTLKLVEINFIENSINQFGCLNFIANNNLENRIKLINLKFILNNGTYGAAIFAKKVVIDIYNNYFIENNAREQGGAIYMENCNNNFMIINSFILKNKAQQGGGIYFNGQNKINKNNIKNTLIKLNLAEKLADNIFELPNHLALSINSNIMLSSQQMTENLTTNNLKLNSYQIIEQGQLITTKQLYLPSSQQIINYKIFNPQNQGYIQYIYQFSLFFQNSINEKVSNIINFTCNLQIFTQNEKNQSISDPKPIEVLPYNQETNTFDLEKYSFTFDPYLNNDQNILVQINCSTEQALNTIRYILTAKTLKCQLGEFYINNGCQLCQSNQGFYSVTYNSTKCSIFDKTKFQNITSNKIQLLEGFWRPDLLSDYSELCFKQQQYCLGGWEVGNDLCFRGHVGGLCEECDNYNIRGEGNYYKNLQKYNCESCSYITNSVLSFIIASLWAILQILLTLKSIDRSNHLFQSLKLRAKYSKILFKLNQDHQSILIKMFVNFLWIFSVIFSFNIQFSFSFGFVDQASNPSNFMATSLDCYLLEFQYIQLSYSRIIAMLVLIILQMITIFLGFRILCFITNTKFNNSVISNTALYLYVSNFAALIKQFSSLLARRSISNIDYVQGNVSLMFDTESHQKWIFSFILPGLGFIGCFIPMFLFSLMFVMRRKLDLIKFRRHICYMFNEYDEHCYFWEYIKIWKKTILIIILTYFETNILLKASLLGLSLLVYQLLTVKAKPYVNQKLNSLDLETGQICSISIFLAATKYVCEQQSNLTYSYLLQTFIILLCIKLCYPFIYEIFRVYQKKYKNNVLSLVLQTIKFCNNRSKWVLYLNKKLNDSKEREQQLKANFKKLKQYLFSISKIQSDNQKLHISLQQPKSTFRILTSRENENIKFMKTDQE